MVAELLHFVFLDYFVSTKTSNWYRYVWPAWKFFLVNPVIKPARLYQLSGRCWKCGADCNRTGVLPMLCCLVGTTFVVIILNSPHEFPIWNATLVGKRRIVVPGIETIRTMQSQELNLESSYRIWRRVHVWEMWNFASPNRGRLHFFLTISHRILPKV